MTRAVSRMLAGLLAIAMLAPAGLDARTPAPCSAGTLYLTIDTGWGREAEKIAEILKRRGIRATLFVANEPTHRGDRSLEPGWAEFWRARAAEGHVFASHTDRHWYFRGDPAPGIVRFVSFNNKNEERLDQAAMCRELNAPIERLRAAVPDAVVLPLWRAPGGITTPNALRMAESCGFRHQGWTSNGFLGDELNSDTHPNAVLRDRAIRSIRDGEVLVMHWGVRSRKEPYANVLDDVLAGLQASGFCFGQLSAEGRR
ncbi:MAG: polysaccharide deacetylase family protein [Roseomonas sp.]|nr:polysaccharide deacetylase family protein [Roseomonas sp.]MCA3429765.1 polysaccharide deacetylase family protein [Roseomonas sp.]MCA3433508.1 polysaccharide deacetylase family protein [Roseomonas sp.]MCZ8280070.1 polysaccharide deacetylase family protein [Acetobacteraceae bacterium]